MNSDPTTTYLSSDDLVALLDADPGLQLVDVREPDEFADWKIPGALNIPLAELDRRLDEVSKSRRVVTVCAKGERASRGSAVLQEHGVASEVLDGGMGAWASTYDVVEGDFDGATVIQVRRRGKGCLSYVVGAGERAVVIDPSLDIDRYVSIARAHAWSITHVLDTHLHADHLSGARRLAVASGAALWLNPADPFRFDFEAITDAKSIELSPGVHLRVSSVCVPGHTEGSTMYQLGERAIFTGDTLFLESVGRPDLADQAEDYAHHLFHSLHERVLPLADEVTVFPAHFGPGVVVRTGVFVALPLGSLRHELAPLGLGEDDFVEWAMANVKDRPGNYQKIVRINAGEDELTSEATELELGPNRCAIN